MFLVICVASGVIGEISDFGGKVNGVYFVSGRLFHHAVAAMLVRASFEVSFLSCYWQSPTF